MSRDLSGDPLDSFSVLQSHNLHYVIELGDLHRKRGLGESADTPLPGLLDVLREVKEAFRREKVNYALCGTLALSFYSRAQVTAALEFAGLAAQREAISRALGDAGFRGSGRTTPNRLGFVAARGVIEISVLLGTAAPEIDAIAEPLPADCVGVTLPVSRPEYLLWMYCRSKDVQHRIDAVTLLRGEQVDVPELRRFLVQAGDTAAGRQLSTLQLLAAYEASLGDYSASMARRLAAPRGLPQAVALRVLEAPHVPERDPPELPLPFSSEHA